MESAKSSVHFDQHAASSHDQKWAKLAPLHAGVHLLISAVFADLPANARILSVGVGTGTELIYFAERFPQWHFTAVEPSAAMLQVCRRRAEEHSIASRCHFHEGYLDSLPPTEAFDAATSLLVSQFVLQREARVAFFRAIAQRLRPGGYLASADLACDMNSAADQGLLELWLQLMKVADFPPEMIERLRVVYGRDVAVVPPDEVRTIIASGGFEAPRQFFQGGLIHAWFSQRRAT